MSNIKLKKILEENFSGTVLGGVVSGNPWHNDISLTKIVKEKYGEIEDKDVDVKALTSEISNYQKLGKQIFGESNITQIAEKLSWIATQAKSHSLQETDDWFDKITVNRNMKELTGLSKQFSSIANESKSLQERMSALYEDMGHILGRYYEVGEKTGPTIKEGEYEVFFQSAMKKFGISSPDELDDNKKKEFFDYVDKNYKADNETD